MWGSFPPERSATGTYASPITQPFRFGSPFAARRVPMKNYSLILKVTLSVSLIVLSVAVPVNYGLAGSTGKGVSQVADGVPLPPPVPPRGASFQVADGVPLPPPIPPQLKSVVVYIAGRVPLPPQFLPPP